MLDIQHNITTVMFLALIILSIAAMIIGAFALGAAVKTQVLVQQESSNRQDSQDTASQEITMLNNRISNLEETQKTILIEIQDAKAQLSQLVDSAHK